MASISAEDSFVAAMLQPLQLAQPGAAGMVIGADAVLFTQPAAPAPAPPELLARAAVLTQAQALPTTTAVAPFLSAQPWPFSNLFDQVNEAVTAAEQQSRVATGPAARLTVHPGGSMPPADGGGAEERVPKRYKREKLRHTCSFAGCKSGACKAHDVRPRVGDMVGDARESTSC